ncbi:hypothetical protein JCM21900_003216 [Sporobolomyces salmonicolor]
MLAYSKLLLGVVFALFAVTSLTVAAPVADSQTVTLEARAARINEIRALRANAVAFNRENLFRRRDGSSPLLEKKDSGFSVEKRQRNRGDRGRGGNGRGGNGRGGDGRGSGHNSTGSLDNADNCGFPGVVCAESYNGVGQRVCNLGTCKLECPRGLRQFFTNHPEFPSFCA